MILNPSTTGLIILGASEFPNFYNPDDPVEEHQKPKDRLSFSRAHEDVRDYFVNQVQIPTSDAAEDPVNGIKDLFDSDLSSDDQMEAISTFVNPDGNPRFSDVFVYIVTHGEASSVKRDSNSNFVRKPKYFLKIRQSISENHEATRHRTYIDFEILHNEMDKNAQCRLYFIVDACHSGVIHLERDGSKPSFDPLKYPEEISRDPGNRGTVILTANSTLRVGNVFGPDRFELPLFSRAWLEILHKGIGNGHNSGLSFHLLQHEINRICFREMYNMEVAVFNTAQVGDRDFTGTDLKLSDIPVFPNMHPGNANAIRNRERVLKEKYYLEAKIEKHKETLCSVWTGRRKEQKKAKKASKKIGKRNNKIEALNGENARLRWFIGLAAVLPLAAVVLLLAYGPADWAAAVGETIVSRAKTGG